MMPPLSIAPLDEASAPAIRTLLEADEGVGLAKEAVLVGQLLAREGHVQPVRARRQLLGFHRHRRAAAPAAPH